LAPDDEGQGRWIDAPVRDEFVVIVGDMLERYTTVVLLLCKAGFIPARKILAL
jgi:hypothetical protein